MTAALGGRLPTGSDGEQFTGSDLTPRFNVLAQHRTVLCVPGLNVSNTALITQHVSDPTGASNTTNLQRRAPASSLLSGRLLLRFTLSHYRDRTSRVVFQMFRDPLVEAVNPLIQISMWARRLTGAPSWQLNVTLSYV